MDVFEFYRIAFAAAPQSVWTAPDAINLLGHYAPYTRGFAMPITLVGQEQVAYGPREDRHVVARSAEDPEAVFDIHLDAWDPGAFYGPLGSKVAAVVQAFQSAGEGLRGANLVIGSPHHEFLGYIPSLPENGLITLLAQVLAYTVHAVTDPARIARLAHAASHDILAWRTSLLDHLAVLNGQDAHAMLADWNDDSCRPFSCDLRAAGLSLMTVNLMNVEGRFDGDNDAKRNRVLEIQTILGGHDLREYTGQDPAPVVAMLELEPSFARLARHVIEENSRVWHTAGELVYGGSPRLLGPVLTASHASLRDDYGLVVPEAETVISAALGAGALGARITGGPSGVWVVALVEHANYDSAAAAVTDAADMSGIRTQITETMPTDGLHSTYPDPDDPY